MRIAQRRNLPTGVYELPSGSWQVQVRYQGKQRYIGKFPTLEQATLANGIAQSMFKKDEGLELSAEECQRNIKLAKEAATASCIKRGRGRPTKSKQTVPVFQENDTFLSLSNPTYKSVLYKHFQQMDNNDTQEEEKRMATKITDIFKKNGGRFYKKSGRGNREMAFVQVDEDDALRSE